MGFLVVKDIYKCQQVCKELHTVSSDWQIWAKLVFKLWKTKVREAWRVPVPTKLTCCMSITDVDGKDLKIDLDRFMGSNQGEVSEQKSWDEDSQAPTSFCTWQECYKHTVHDTHRTALTPEELCSLTWSFRFKRGAGVFWAESDPFWLGQPPVKTQFMPTGDVWRFQGSRRIDHDFPIVWRFTKSRFGKRGTFVKLNQWPSLIISRTERGGWRLESEWVLHTTDPAEDQQFLDVSNDTDPEDSSSDEEEEVDPE